MRISDKEKIYNFIYIDKGTRFDGVSGCTKTNPPRRRLVLMMVLLHKTAREIRINNLKENLQKILNS